MEKALRNFPLPSNPIREFLEEIERLKAYMTYTQCLKLD